MTTAFPGDLDTFTNPIGTDQQDSATVPHAEQHANINDAMAAVQAVVGKSASAVTTSHTYKLSVVSGSFVAVSSENFSGTSYNTNTGDQTITLTGHVTGSGTGSFATTIASGVVTEAMQVLADNTTQDVSTSKHGYVPKAPNDTGKFLRGDGTWAAATAGAAGLDTQVQFNDGGSALGGDAGLTYNKTTDTLSIAGNLELGHASDTTIARVSSGVISVEGATVYTQGGALGTPASGTLTNCSGLPVSGITASTSTALGVGSIELGHASDTTIARSAAGIVTIEGVVVQTDKINTITTDTTLDATYRTVLVDTTSGNVTATLPASPTQGQVYNLKKIAAANTMTIARNGKNIDGAAANVTRTVANSNVPLQYDSTYGWCTL